MNINRKSCFVIQPFDNDKFDKRYDDIFEPAIQSVGLKPYRVDRDPTVRIPIEEIERQIRNSAICFADITLNNPNVWYELGFAYACKKEVVLICSEERKDDFPFDIRHKHIIKYKTGSKSDYDVLERAITCKLRALIEHIHEFVERTEQIKYHDGDEKHNLKPYELLMLEELFAAQPTDDDFSFIYTLQESNRKSGYTDLEFSLALRNLTRIGYVTTSKETIDDWGGTTNGCRITEKGVAFIFQQVELQEATLEAQALDDELPF